MREALFWNLAHANLTGKTTLDHYTEERLIPCLRCAKPASILRQSTVDTRGLLAQNANCRKQGKRPT